MGTKNDWLSAKASAPGQGDSMTSDQKIKEVIQTLDQVLDKNKTQFEKFGLVANKSSQMPK